MADNELDTGYRPEIALSDHDPVEERDTYMSTQARNAKRPREDPESSTGLRTPPSSAQSRTQERPRGKRAFPTDGAAHVTAKNRPDALFDARLAFDEGLEELNARRPERPGGAAIPRRLGLAPSSLNSIDAHSQAERNDGVSLNQPAPTSLDVIADRSQAERNDGASLNQPAPIDDDASMASASVAGDLADQMAGLNLGPSDQFGSGVRAIVETPRSRYVSPEKQSEMRHHKLRSQYVENDPTQYRILHLTEDGKRLVRTPIAANLLAKSEHRPVNWAKDTEKVLKRAGFDTVPDFKLKQPSSYTMIVDKKDGHFDTDKVMPKDDCGRAVGDDILLTSVMVTDGGSVGNFLRADVALEKGLMSERNKRLLGIAPNAKERPAPRSAWQPDALAFDPKGQPIDIKNFDKNNPQAAALKGAANPKYTWNTLLRRGDGTGYDTPHTFAARAKQYGSKRYDELSRQYNLPPGLDKKSYTWTPKVLIVEPGKLPENMDKRPEKDRREILAKTSLDKILVQDKGPDGRLNGNMTVLKTVLERDGGKSLHKDVRQQVAPEITAYEDEQRFNKEFDDFSDADFAKIDEIIGATRDPMALDAAGGNLPVSTPTPAGLGTAAPSSAAGRRLDMRDRGQRSVNGL